MAVRTEKARRPRGTGSLDARRDKAGRETWYARYYVEGKLVKRRIGLKRAEGTREGLTRTQAEKALRRLIDEGSPSIPTEKRLDIDEAGEKYLRILSRRAARPPRSRTTAPSYESI